MWMTATGALFLLANLGDFQIPRGFTGSGVLTLVYVTADWLRYAVLLRLLLTYPSGRTENGGERRLSALAFGLSLTAAGTLLLTKTPVPICGDRCGSSPISIVSDAGLYLTLRSFFLVAWAVLSFSAFIFVVRRNRKAGSERQVGTAFLVGTGVLAVLLAVSQLNLIAMYTGLGLPDGTHVTAGLMAMVVVAVAPFAFLLGLLRRRVAFASVGDLVAGLGRLPPDALQARLRIILADPTLLLTFPLSGRLVTVSGALYNPSNGQDARATALGDPPVAVLIHQRRLDRDSELFDAATAAIRLEFDNARLHAQVQAQLAEVMASRQRIVAAADIERRRLERDIHDGAQQRLLGIGMSLAMLRRRLDQAGEQEAIDDLVASVQASISELRALAQGIRPPALTDQGLGPALAGLARQVGATVDLDMAEAQRPDPLIEATAYYVVSEALQNVVKHAANASARVIVRQRAGHITVDVADDGPGGARLQPGGGLRGLTDRVEAVGGRLTLTSPRNGGTHLVAQLPYPAGHMADARPGTARH